MKNIKYIALSLLVSALFSCENDELDALRNQGNEDNGPLPVLTAGEADFSKYVAVGASFSAGFTDNALFIAGQQNSFPNILSQQFANAGGGTFSQPLMSDNIGGFLFGGVPLIVNGTRQFGPRLFFNGAGPAPLPAESTTEGTTVLTGPFNNYGIPGAKSFHLGVAGYGTLNPYFGRMASSAGATVLGDAVGQSPTFFTLSEIGGNDVLAYATSGGTGVYQLGNFNPATYGGGDITDPNVFAASFEASVQALTSNGAKGVVANVPYITNLPHFTTVPHDPLSPTNPSFGPQIPLLNSIFGALNQIYVALGQPNRVVVFSTTENSAVVIKDETLTNLAPQIAGALNASPTFPAFIAQFGLPPQAAPLVANLLGATYGQTRQATEDDLLVLPSSSIIGTVNTANVMALMGQGLSQALAGQFSVEGVTLPLEDKWVLIPSEQMNITAATDLYNQAIESVANQYDVALVDFKSILQIASTTGFSDGNFILNTNLVTGGLVSLDGVHLTSRGYAVMANEFLKAIDTKYGSNFIAAGFNVNVGNYPTNYPPTLQ